MTPYSHLLANPTFDGALGELEAALGRVLELQAIDEAAAAAPIAPGKWSRRQILGHLVDSALNNLQRFIRAQIPTHLTGGVLRQPTYAPNEWVRVSGHGDRAWSEVVQLWSVLNAHVVHVLRRADRSLLSTPCVIGDPAGPPLPLEHLAIDYVGHIKHHLRQIAGERPGPA